MGVVSWLVAWFLSGSLLFGCSLQTTREEPRWWPDEPPPSLDLLAALDTTQTPLGIAQVIKGFADTGGDLPVWAAPETYWRERGGNCTASARFWMFALGRKGYEVFFVSMWRDNGKEGHAVCLFKDRGSWYQNLGPRVDPVHLGSDFVSAIKGAAERRYPDWGLARLYTSNGYVAAEWRR